MRTTRTRVAPRRPSLAVSAVLIALAASAPVAAQEIPLSEATIEDLNAAFDSGRLTAEALVEMYLARIEAYDQQGPALNTVLWLNERAIERARELDAERRRSGPRRVLLERLWPG